MEKMKKKAASRKGFTMAEMLIVMAVAVVLAAATIPSITGQIEKGKEANDITTLANAYADAYADAAVLASTHSGTENRILVSRDVTIQQGTNTWTLTTSPTLGGASIPNVDTTTKSVEFCFEILSGGGIKLATTFPTGTTAAITASTSVGTHTTPSLATAAAV